MTTIATKNITLMFRPQGVPQRFLVKERRLRGTNQNYNFQRRITWIPVGWRLNKQTIGRAHARLHYLACHAPAPIQKQWAKVYKEFCDKRFGTRGRASVRYLNQWSCHSWM